MDSIGRPQMHRLVVVAFVTLVATILGCTSKSTESNAAGDGGLPEVINGSADADASEVRATSDSSEIDAGQEKGDTRSEAAEDGGDVRADGFRGDRTEYRVGTGPRAIALADLDGDGLLDIVVADHGTGASDDGGFDVLLNDGRGNFAAGRHYAAGLQADENVYRDLNLAIADLNGDGRPDVAVTGIRSDSGIVSLFFNHGDGTFAAPIDYPTGARLVAVAAGDLDSDGDIDIAVAWAGTVNGEGSGLGIFLNEGDGLLRAPIPFAIAAPVSVAIADLNRDGHLDIAVTDLSGHVGVLFNNSSGNGVFTAPTEYFVFNDAFQALWIAIADVNGDGAADMIFARSGRDLSPGDVYVLLNSGGAMFEASADYASGAARPIPAAGRAGTGPYGLAVGDLNGDDHPDVVLANGGSVDAAANVSLLLNRGDGTFEGPTSAATRDLRPNSVAVADLNGDGRADIAFTSTPDVFSASSPGTVSVLLNLAF